MAEWNDKLAAFSTLDPPVGVNCVFLPLPGAPVVVEVMAWGVLCVNDSRRFLLSRTHVTDRGDGIFGVFAEPLPFVDILDAVVVVGVTVRIAEGRFPCCCCC